MESADSRERGCVALVANAVCDDKQVFDRSAF
jgi:hypothetical protein